MSADNAQAIRDAARQLGIDPVVLAGIIHRETAGSMSPDQWGGMRRDGSDRGRFGEARMDMGRATPAQLYASILAGNPMSVGTPDVNNTASGSVSDIMRRGRAFAQRYGWSADNPPVPSNAPLSASGVPIVAAAQMMAPPALPSPPREVSMPPIFAGVPGFAEGGEVGRILHDQYGQGFVSPALANHQADPTNETGRAPTYSLADAIHAVPEDTLGLRSAADRVRDASRPDNMLAGGLDTAANWINGTPHVGPDTLAPLGAGILASFLARPRPHFTQPTEWPTQAAVQIGDRIFTGNSHFDAVTAAQRALGDDIFASRNASNPRGWGGSNSVGLDGFITNAGRYVTRAEAGRLVDGDYVMRSLPFMSEALENQQFPIRSNYGWGSTLAFKNGGRVVHDLDINIEQRKGSIRSGVGKDGKPWNVKMPCAYGDIKRTKAADGERVDCYIGSDPSDKVWVVDQVDAHTGKYDEAKVLMNFTSKRDALAAYEKAFSDGKGRDRIGSVSEMSVDGFRDWLESGNTKKPVGDLRKDFADGGPVQPYSSRLAELMLNARPYYRQSVEPLPPNDGSFVPSNPPPERQGGPVRVLRDLDGDGYRMLPGTNRGLATRNWLQTGQHDGILPPAFPQTTDRSGGLGKGILPGPQASLEFARGGTPMTKRYADGGPPREEQLGQHNFLSRLLASYGRPSAETLQRGLDGTATPQEVAHSFFMNGPMGPFGTASAFRRPPPAALTREQQIDAGRRDLYAMPQGPLGGIREWLSARGSTPADASRLTQGSVDFLTATPPARLHADGGRVGYEGGGEVEPLIPGGLPPLPSDAPLPPPPSGAFSEFDYDPIQRYRDHQSVVDATAERGYPMQPNGLADLSGTPAFGRRGFMAGLPYFGAEVAGEALPFALGPAGRALNAIPSMVSAAPRVASGVAAITGLTAASEAANPDRRPARDALQSTIEQSDPTLQALRRQIDAQNAIANAKPADQVQSNRVRAAAHAAELQKQYNERLSHLTRANQPFDQAHPWVSENRALLGIGLPILAGSMARNIGNWHASAGSAPWRTAVRRAEQNMAATTPAGEAAFEYNAGRAIRALENSPPAAVNATGGFWRNNVNPSIAGGFVGGEFSALPHQHNRTNALPGSPERLAAEEALSSTNIAGTLFPGVAMGIAGGLTGSHVLPSFGPGHRPVAESQSILDMMRRRGLIDQNNVPTPRPPTSGPGVPTGGAPIPLSPPTPGLPPPPMSEARMIDNMRAGRLAVPEETLAPAAVPAMAPLAGRPLVPGGMPNLPAPSNTNAPAPFTPVEDARGRINLHSTDHGRFSVNPESVRQRRLRDRKQDGSEEEGHKNGGLISRALELARKFGGRAKQGYADGGGPSDNAAWEQIGDERYQIAPVPPLPVDPLALLGMRFGFRGAPQLGRGPWTPPEPRPNIVRQAKQSGDDNTGQNIYEALLGRLRRPGEAVARPGSGWWMVGGQPIPKPSNPLPWAVAGGGAYLAGRAGYNAMDELLGHPGSPEYIQRQQERQNAERTRDPERENLERSEYGFRRGWEGPVSIFGDRPLSRFALEPLPGAPYAHGGQVSEGSGPVVAGPILGTDGGRDDAKPVSVKSGSFVIPSHVVSGLPGAGSNSLAGMRMLEQFFGKPSPHAMASGGPASDIPIKISSGEFVVTPEQVARIGGGDMERGHRVLDAFCVQVQRQHAKEVAKLPRPATD